MSLRPRKRRKTTLETYAEQTYEENYVPLDHEGRLAILEPHAEQTGAETHVFWTMNKEKNNF